MKETSRQKYEKSILLWLSVIGIPLALGIALFSWMGLKIQLYLPISILIAMACGLITYTILLKADIKDKDKEISNLKTKIRTGKHGKKKK